MIDFWLWVAAAECLLGVWVIMGMVIVGWLLTRGGSPWKSN